MPTKTAGQQQTGGCGSFGGDMVLWLADIYRSQRECPSIDFHMRVKLFGHLLMVDPRKDL